MTALRSEKKKSHVKNRVGQIWANVLDKLSSDEKSYRAKLSDVWGNLLQIGQGPQARMDALSKFTEFLNNPESSLSEIDQKSLVRVAIATLLPTATQDELWMMMKNDIAAKMLLEAYVNNNGSSPLLTQMWDKLLNGDASPDAARKGQENFALLLAQGKMKKDENDVGSRVLMML